jgi:hypothetical protein
VLVGQALDNGNKQTRRRERPILAAPGANSADVDGNDGIKDGKELTGRLEKGHQNPTRASVVRRGGDQWEAHQDGPIIIDARQNGECLLNR